MVLAVPSAVSASVKPYAVPDAGTLVKLRVVMLAFKLTAKTLPEAQSRESVPDEMLGAVLVSFSPVIVGVVSVGDVPKTFAPVPVSSVNAAAKFALDGVASQVATLAPNPDNSETAT